MKPLKVRLQEARKKVGFKRPEDFFPETVVSHVEKTWEQWLEPLVPDLPPFKKVMRELRPKIDAVF